MPDRRRDVARRLHAIDGLVESDSMFSDDRAWWVNGKEIAHFHGDDEIEVRLTKPVIRERRPELEADDRVTLRPNASDWITVTLRKPADVAFVVDLVEAAAGAHRPPAGQTAKPPPGGADLARRRRFH